VEGEVSQRWTETNTVTQSVGGVEFNTKWLKGHQRPTPAEIDEAELLAESTKRPLVLYWADEIITAETTIMLVYQASETFVHLKSASRGRRPGSFITETNYGVAEKLISGMHPG
jgi:hypothetical protein